MENLQFKNESLKNAVEVAKAAGLKVFAFQNKEPIGQVFITDEIHIGSIHVRFGSGSIDLLAVYKPCKECGTAVVINEEQLYEVTVEQIKQTFTTFPYWFKNYIQYVKKYNSWNEYIQKSNLKYYEI